MRNIVSKSSPELVGPATTTTKPAPPTGEIINLSPFDKAIGFSPFTSFHVFSNAIADPAMTIKRALSQALVYYYPIAGRVLTGGGKLRVSCTGDGVAFVAATASCALDDVKLFDPPFAALLKELAVDGCGGEADPLLMMQVTEFACGGFVVGVTWNHVIADGKGIAQFLRAVGELARGMPRPSVLPVSCGDESLPELPPLVTAMERTMARQEGNRRFAYLDVTVPASVIRRVKAEFAGDYSGEPPCSVFEAVAAVLWRSRTRAVFGFSGDGDTDADTPAPLVFAANVHKQVGARHGYYGNCVTSQVVLAMCGEVARGGVADAVRLIRRAKEQIPAQFKNAGAGVEVDAAMEEEMGVLFGYNAFYVASWRNIGFEAVDLGGGAPARVMCHVGPTAVPSCVACLPRHDGGGGGDDGASVLLLCVKEEHVDAFLRELDCVAQVNIY